MAKCDVCGDPCEDQPSGYRTMCEDCYAEYTGNKN